MNPNAPRKLVRAGAEPHPGRALLSADRAAGIGPDLRRPGNNLAFRALRGLTDPIVRAVGAITPRVVPGAARDGLRDCVDLCRAHRAGAGCRGDVHAAHDGLTHVDRSRAILQSLLRRDLPLAATVAVAIVNGLDFSPVFDSVFFYSTTFARESPLFDGDLFYYLTSVAITLMTLLLAGIPAAIYERIRGLQQSTPGLAGDLAARHGRC